MGHEVILQKGKIYLPKSLRHQILDWYHWYLCHPGETRIEQTSRSTLTWPGLRPQIRKKNVKTCKQKHFKRQRKTARKMYMFQQKNAEYITWQKVCLDIVGPYKKLQKDKNGKTVINYPPVLSNLWMR